MKIFVLSLLLVPILFSFATPVLSQSTNNVEQISSDVIDEQTLEEANVVGQLKTRQHVVHIFTGPNGSLYTVTDQNGVVKGVKLTEALLAERFPVLKSLLDNPADSADLHSPIEMMVQ